MKIECSFGIILALLIQSGFAITTSASTPSSLPLVNGDFETGPYDSVGNIPGWTVSGNGKVDATTQGATSGTHSAALSVLGDSQANVLSQSFITTAGRIYSLDFDAGVVGTHSGDPLALHIQVSGNSAVLDDIIPPPEVGTFNSNRVVFGHYHYTFTADANVTTLQFSDFVAGNGVADIEVDTVSVAEHVTNSSPTYTVTDLGTFGGTDSAGNGVNAYGQVTGWAYAMGNGAAHAFLSAPDSKPLTDLGTLGGSFSSANAVNASGQVTGRGNSTTGFLSAPNGGPLSDLGTLGGNYCEGLSVNDSGQVAGISLTAGGNTHAFLSGINGGTPLRDLGTFGGPNSIATGVNASGQVTGSAVASDSSSHAFLSGPNGETLDDLGTLGGLYSRGQGVNASGQVTGYGAGFGSNSHAFLSGPNGRNLVDLGPIGPRISGGYGINACGQVVGSSTPDNAPSYPFIFTATGGMRNLKPLILPSNGIQLRDANGINDQGQIAGTGVDSSGKQHAVVLTPNLAIEHGDSNNITLFWPGSCTGPNVQEAPTLAPTENWQAVIAQPTIVDGTYSFAVSVPPDNTAHFYRLTFATGSSTSQAPANQSKQTAHRVENTRGTLR